MIRLVSFTLFLSFFMATTGWSDPIQTKEVDSLNTLAEVDSISLFQQINLGEQALKLAKEIEYPGGLYNANMNIGIGHLNLSNYKEALTHFYDARNLASEINDTTYLAEATYFLGTVNHYLDNFDRAKEAFQASLALYEKLHNVRWMGILKSALGVAYYNAGDLDAGLAAYNEALAIFEENDLEEETAIPINNIGDHHMKIKQPELAISYFERSLALDLKYQSKKGEAISLINLGLCYRDLQQYDKALTFFEQAQIIAKDQHFNNIIVEIYKEVGETYKIMGIPEQSLEYFEKYTTLNDSILSQEKSAQISELWLQYETEKKERALAESREKITRLQQEKEIEQLKTFILAGGIISLFLLGLLLISRYRVKQKLTESELKNKALESERLKKELEFKQQDLTNFALDISRKNEFSNRTHQALKDISKSNDIDFRRKKIRELLMLTSNHLKINDDIKEFQMNVEKVNHDFFSKLEQRFPDLTNTDKQLCGLIRLQLSTKDIASVRNVSPKTIEMGRYRLRKKLNLKPEEEISNFLQEI